MRAVFGLLLIMLGLAMAVVWMPGDNAERQLAVVTDIATQGLPRRADGSERGVRTFASNTPLLAAVEPPGPRALQVSASVARVVSQKPEAMDRPAFPVAQPAALPSVVTTAITMPPAVYHSLASRTQSTAPTSMPTRPTPTPEISRYDLIRSIQRELKRVGCYAGDVDGDWGPGSRRAIIGFTDRVNATLPTAQPDFILLTLLQGHQGTACGRTCPAGQSLSDNGRCLPNAVLTHARSVEERRQTAAATASQSQPNVWTATATRGGNMTNTGVTPSAVAAIVTRATGSGPPVADSLAGRMSVGAPPSRLAALPAPAPAHAAEQETVDQTVRAGTSARRERSRRRAARPAARRYVYAPGAPAFYRAPRVVRPRYYASTARRTSRSWTATFFATH